LRNSALVLFEDTANYLRSVYFTAKMLAATDWLELLCRHSKIRSRGT